MITQGKTGRLRNEFEVRAVDKVNTLVSAVLVLSVLLEPNGPNEIAAHLPPYNSILEKQKRLVPTEPCPSMKQQSGKQASKHKNGQATDLDKVISTLLVDDARQAARHGLKCHPAEGLDLCVQGAGDTRSRWCSSGCTQAEDKSRTREESDSGMFSRQSPVSLVV